MLDRLEVVRTQVGDALDKALHELPAGELRDAMRYAYVGGKRLRAFLAMESARLHEIDDASALPVAAAVEAVHAYSLVHDDLPAMDDDDLRRGMPTCHIQWSEATAILAGDALQALAFDLLCDPVIGTEAARLALVRGLAQAAGGAGMVWGQALDIAAETAAEAPDLSAIKRLQAAKTGALFQFAATAGPVISGDDPKPLRTYSRAIGLAFQITDDLLDLTGSEETTGKRVGKDEERGKATFISLLGQKEAQAMAQRLVTEAQDALSPYGEDAGNLRDLARFVIERDT